MVLSKERNEKMERVLTMLGRVGCTWDVPVECGFDPDQDEGLELFNEIESDTIVKGKYYGFKITDNSIQTFLMGQAYPHPNDWLVQGRACDGAWIEYFSDRKSAEDYMRGYVKRDRYDVGNAYSTDEGQSVLLWECK